MHVFVLDTNKRPLSPCHPATARKLLKQGKAAIFKLNGFDAHPQNLKTIHRADGYEYALRAQVSSPQLKPGAPTCA